MSEATERGGVTRKPLPAGYVLECLQEFVERKDEGSIGIGFNRFNPQGQFSVSVVFGSERPDSPMAEGSAHGMADDLGDALAQAARECGLELRPPMEQRLHDATHHVTSLLRREWVSETDRMTDETAARRWLSEQ